MPTDEHVVIMQTEFQQKEEMLSVEELPQLAKADLGVRTVEHVVVSETEIAVKEADLSDYQKPKELKVDVTVPSEEHIEVSEVEIDMKEKALMPDKSPATVQASFTMSTDEHVIVMQPEYHQKEDSLPLEEKPSLVIADISMPTTEHLIVSETKSDVKETELDEFKKPKESHVVVTLPAEESIEVSEVEIDDKEKTLTPDKMPASVKASFTMPTDEHVIVMQTESHQKEDIFTQDRRPSEINVDFTVSSKKHVIVSQVLSETKEEEFISKDIPKTATADLSVSSKEHLIVTETLFQSSEKALKIEDSPSPVIAGYTMPAKEHIEVSQIQPQSREFDLTLEKKPKEETAGISLPTESHFEVSEVEAHVKPEDMPEKRPEYIKADVTLPTTEHVIVSETESSLQVKEFSTTKPTSGKAKQTLAVKEPIKVDEVPGEVSIEQQITFPKKILIPQKKDIDQGYLEFEMEEATEFSMEKPKKKTAEIIEEPSKADEVPSEVSIEQQVKVPKKILIPQKKDIDQGYLEFEEAIDFLMEKPKEKTAEIVEEPHMEEAKIKETVEDTLADEFSPFTVTLPEEETIEENIDTSVTKKRTVKVHKKMKGGKLVEVKEIVETFSSVPSEKSKPIIEDITETDTDFLQPISSKEPVIEEVEEIIPAKTEITDMPTEINAIVEEAVSEETDDSRITIKKKPKKKSEKEPLSKDESSEEDSDKTVIKLKKKKSIVEEIGIIPAPKSEKKEKEQIVSIPNIETMNEDVEILIEESEDILPKSKAKVSRKGPEVFISEVNETKTEIPILPVDDVDKSEDVGLTKLKLKKGKKPLKDDETIILKEKNKEDTGETTEIKLKPKRKSIVVEKSDTTFHVPCEKTEFESDTDILKPKSEDEIAPIETEIKIVKLKKKPKTEDEKEAKPKVLDEDEKTEAEIIPIKQPEKPAKPDDSADKIIKLKKKPKQIQDTEITTDIPKEGVEESVEIPMQLKPKHTFEDKTEIAELILEESDEIQAVESIDIQPKTSDSTKPIKPLFKEGPSPQISEIIKTADESMTVMLKESESDLDEIIHKPLKIEEHEWKEHEVKLIQIEDTVVTKQGITISRTQEEVSIKKSTLEKVKPLSDTAEVKRAPVKEDQDAPEEKIYLLEEPAKIIEKLPEEIIKEEPKSFLMEEAETIEETVKRIKKKPKEDEQKPSIVEETQEKAVLKLKKKKKEDEKPEETVEAVIDMKEKPKEVTTETEEKAVLKIKKKEEKEDVVKVVERKPTLKDLKKEEIEEKTVLKIKRKPSIKTAKELEEAIEPERTDEFTSEPIPFDTADSKLIKSDAEEKVQKITEISVLKSEEKPEIEKTEKVTLKKKPSKKEEAPVEEFKVVQKPEEVTECKVEETEETFSLSVQKPKDIEHFEEEKTELVVKQTEEMKYTVEETTVDLKVKKKVLSEEPAPLQPEITEIPEKEEKVKFKRKPKKEPEPVSEEIKIIKRPEQKPEKEVIEEEFKIDITTKPTTREETVQETSFELITSEIKETAIKIQEHKAELTVRKFVEEIVPVKPETAKIEEIPEDKLPETKESTEVPEKPTEEKVKLKRKPKVKEESPSDETVLPLKPSVKEIEKPEDTEESFKVDIPKKPVRETTFEETKVELTVQEKKEVKLEQEVAEIIVQKKEEVPKEEIEKTTLKMKKKPKKPEEEPEVAEFKILQKPEPKEEKPQEVEAFELKVKPKEEEKPQIIEEISEVIELKPEKPEEYAVVEEKAEVIIKKKEIPKEEEVEKTTFKMKKKPKKPKEEPEVAEFKIPQKTEPEEEKPQEVEEAFALKIKPKEEEKPQIVEEISEVIELKPEKPEEYAVVEEKAEVTIKKKEITKEEEVVKTVKMKKKPKKPEEQPEVAEFKIPQKPEPEEEKPQEVEQAFALKIKPKEEEKPQVVEEISEVIELKPEKPEEYAVVEEKAEVTIKKKEIPKEEEVVKTVKMKKKPKKPEQEPEVAEFKIPQKPELKEEKPQEVEEAFELKIKPKEEEKPQVVEEISEVIELKPEKPEEYAVVEEKAEVTIKKKAIEKEEEVVKTVKMKKKPKKPEEQPEIAEFKIPQKREPEEEKPEEIEESFELKIKPKEEEKPQVVEEISEIIELKPEKPEEYTVVEEVAAVTIKKEYTKEIEPKEEKPETTVIKRKKKVAPERKKSESPIEETFAIPLVEKKESSPEETSVEEKFTVGLKKQEKKVVEAIEETVSVTVEDKKVQEYKTEEVTEEITIKKVAEKPDKPQEPVKKEEIEVTEKLKLKKKHEPKTEEKPVEETFAIPMKKEEPLKEEIPTEEQFSVKLKEKVKVTEEKTAEESFELVIQEEKPKPKEEVIAEETTVVLKPKDEAKRKPSVKEEVEEKTTVKLKPKKKEPEKKPEDTAETFVIPASKKPVDEKQEEEKPVEEEFKIAISKKKKVVEEAEEEAKIIIPSPEEKEYKITDVSEDITVKKVVEEKEETVSFKKRKEVKKKESISEEFKISVKPEETKEKSPEPEPTQFKVDLPRKVTPKQITDDEDSLKLKIPDQEKPEISEENVEITVKKKAPVEQHKITRDDDQRVSRKTLKKKISEEDVTESFTINRKKSFEDIKKTEEVEETFQVKTVPKKKPKEVSMEEDSLKLTIPDTKRTETTEENVEITVKKKAVVDEKKVTKEEEQKISIKKPKKKIEDEKVAESFTVSRKQSIDEKKPIEDVEETFQIKTTPKKKPQVFAEDEESLSISLSEKRDYKTEEVAEETMVTLKKTEETKEELMEILEVTEYVAISSFIAEKSDSVSLVEGERVEVIEKTSQDWWFVRKVVTNEKGFVPPSVLEDSATYTHYMKDTLSKKIEKLPVLRKPKPGEKMTAPKFVKKLTPMKVVDGQTAEISCQVTGNPRPTITWFKQTQIIKPSMEFQIFYDEDNVTTLIIREVFPEDAGTYTVVAKNAAGFASCSADLIVDTPFSDHGSETFPSSRLSLSRQSSLTDILEGIPPVFAEKPKDKKVDEGKPVELICKVTGIPEPKITWLRNQKPLKESDRVEITTVTEDLDITKVIVTIKKTKIEDAGTYEIIAENREGKSVTSLILNVTEKPKKPKEEPPVFSQTYSDITCSEKDTVSLTVKVQGTPTPEVKWYKNGKELKPSKNITQTVKDDVHTLTVSDTKEADTGDYKCVAKNPKGTVEHTAKVTVQKTGVDFVEKLYDVEVKERESALFSIEVSHPSAQVTWHKDGEKLKPTDRIKFVEDGCTRKLIIEDANVNDEGEYTCVLGEKECTAELVVVELPPDFKGEMKDVTVAKEQSATFQVELTKGDARARWFKDDKEIDFSEHVMLKIDGKRQKLIIYNAAFEDAGTYTCVVGNKKRTANLKVEAPTVEFTAKLPDKMTVPQDTDVSFTVELSRPDVPVQWLKNGSPIPEKQKEKFQFVKERNVYKLIVQRAQKDDAAEYSCVAGNVKTTTKLQVQEAHAEFTLKLRDVIVRESDTATLLVEVTRETFEVRWMKDGQTIKPTDRMIMEKEGCRRRLIIKDTTLEDRGMYTCVLDEKTCSSTLTVETTPRVVSEKRHFKGKKGSNVVVDVEFMALPQPKIEWFYKGKSITADKKRSIENYGNKTVITIKKIDEPDVGDYTLKLTNKCGEAKTDFTVSIIDKPKPPGVPNASEITDTALTLSWKVPDSDGGSPITNYIIEYHDRNTLRWSTYNESFTINQPFTKVEKLKQGEEYMFRIIAVNEVGKSDPSPGTKYILVQEPRAGEPPAVVEHLKPVTCGLKKPATLTCRISGQPPPTIKWFKNGKEIVVMKASMTATYENQIATLKISETTDKSAGTYTCKASNNLGAVETTTELAIQEPPTIQYDESMKNVRLKSRSEYILDIKVFGYPSPELVWLKNGKVLESTKHTLVQVREDSTTITIRSVENTDSATYTLQLTNPAGTVKYDFRLFVLDKPLPPEGPIAFHKIEKTSVTIGWQPPSIGGSEVLSYIIEKCEVRRKVWMEVTTVKSDVLTQEITDLSEGIEYAFRVIATNEYGRSDPLTSDPVAPKSLFDKPHAPKGPFTTSNMTENSFTLSWLAPDNDGGSPIIEYIVERKEANRKAWQRVATTDGKTLSVEVTGLKKDTACHFRVCCRNEIGHSPYFAPDETITPGLKISAPSSPVGPLAILNMTNKTVTLSWKPPANNGGADLTAYIIEKRESTKTAWNRLETLEAHVTTYTVHNLTHKKEYFFRVFAENPAGLSPPLETEKPIKLTSTAVRPSPPTDPLEVVVTGPSSILLSWGRPESDGGSPILGYTVAMKNVRRIMWMEVGQVDGETQRLQVKDLQEGSEYMVRIMARNEVGVSDPLEPEEPIKVIRPPGFKESEKPEVDEKTISVSYSTETSSSWMREANMEPLLHSYTKHVLAGRNEYFFRLWHLAESIFK